MLLNLLLLAVGAGALYFGAEWLVRGGVRLGVSFGLSPMVIGLTIVSLGTSAPELVVCVVAAISGNSDLAIGNVIGSNLANIGLILGITALIYPLKVAPRVVAREVPAMLIITVLAYPLLLDGQIARGNGAGLLVLLVAYLGYLFWIRKQAGAWVDPALELQLKAEAGAGATTEAAGGTRGPSALPGEHRASGGPVATGDPAPASGAAPARRVKGSVLTSVGLIAGGAVGLMLGGEVVVRAATVLAETLGLSQLFIGLTIVAVGTSLPEMATSIVAALRREADIAVGNIIGSNIFNLTAVLGISAVIQPIDVSPDIMLAEYPAMALLSLILLPVAWTAYCIRRWEGAILVAFYGSALWWLFR
jgi:cation:H+ antiporter